MAFSDTLATDVDGGMMGKAAAQKATDGIYETIDWVLRSEYGPSKIPNPR